MPQRTAPRRGIRWNAGSSLEPGSGDHRESWRPRSQVIRYGGSGRWESTTAEGVRLTAAVSCTPYAIRRQLTAPYAIPFAIAFSTASPNVSISSTLVYTLGDVSYTHQTL